MLLAASVFSVVTDYVGILFFTCLPVLVLSVSLAVWLHYRKKRRASLIKDRTLTHEEGTSAGETVSLTSVETAVLPPEADEDKVVLAKECRKQLKKNKARYFALKQDFSSTQKNITGHENESPENIIYMENLDEKIAVYEKQILDLQNKLEVLETAIPVHDETHFLRQALREKDIEIAELKDKIAAVASANETEDNAGNNYSHANELIKRIERLQEEKADADRKLNEQEYIRDAYAQSKLQVEFLQNQLEERIKNHSHSEQKLKELNALLNDTGSHSNELEGKIQYLNQQLESRQRELEQVQLISDQKDSEIHRVKEELQTKNSQVSHFEKLLAELKEQNSILNISFGESQNEIAILKEQIAGEQQHIHHMEDKLLKNRQLIERVYRDLESSVLLNEQSDSQEALVKTMY